MTGARVEIAGDLGGLVTSLVLGGRQWLYRNEALSFESRRRARLASRTAYVDQADCGLGDSCFPTVGADTVRLPDGSSLDLLDHGLLWCTPASTAGTTTTWRTEGFTFRRTMTFQGEDRLEVGLSVVNTGRIPLPHFWSSHDMLPLTEHTRLELPPGTRIRIFSAHGFQPAPGEHAWPRLGTLDLSHPARLRAELGRDFAFKLFSVEDAGPLKVREGDRELELSGPGTRAGLWVNWGGWAPEALRARGVRYQSLCPERCIGGPTDLPSEGLAMGTTKWIEPGEERAWAYEYLGR